MDLIESVWFGSYSFMGSSVSVGIREWWATKTHVGFESLIPHRVSLIPRSFSGATAPVSAEPK